MLSPSSPAQKNLCTEDSSGSDAGSELGLEPETDRFGFIVTNGSTAGSVGPPPELVRQREAKWINIIVQWERILFKKTSKVKVQCQKGIPASLRAKCWPLLCGATDRIKHNENLYQSLDSQPALQSWVDVIERDLDRQFPFHEMFLSKDGHGQRGLFRVLKAYTQYRPEEGYCQAQGPVAAVLLMNMPAEEAFWCLVQISEQYLPGYYSPLLEGVLFDAGMLTWVLKRTCPAAHKHLQHHGVEPLMFATDWLMCLFTRHLPFNTLLRVWDLFFCYGVRVLLQVAVVLVRRVLGRAEQRKQCQGQMETLEKLRGVKEQVQEEDDSFVAEVCSVPLSAKDLEKQTEKEFNKWRNDRPSSTFDPRGRCQGYRMVWAKARHKEEEKDRQEREKGNLSIPLARSASTLSLSPAILHKRWRKGGKVTAGDWEGGNRVARHFSMGAKEDCRSWTELSLKVQRVQEEEDVVFKENTKKSETKLTVQTEQIEPEEEDKLHNTETEQVKEEVTVKEQTEQVETRVTEKEESHVKEIEESKKLTEKSLETSVETETTTGPTKDQTVENILLTSHQSSDLSEELDASMSCDGQSQDIERQTSKSQDREIEVKDTNKETDRQEVENEHTPAVEENQTEVQRDSDDTNTEVGTQESEEQIIRAEMNPEENIENENVHQSQVDTVTEVSEGTNDTSSETDGGVEAPTVKDPPVETETQQQEQEVITTTDRVEAPAMKDLPVETETQQQEQEVIKETDGGVETPAMKDLPVETETQQQEQEVIKETDGGVEAPTVKDPPVETETETQQQEQEVIKETDGGVEAPTVKDPPVETETETQQQEQEQEVITTTDSSSQGDSFEGKCHSSESLEENDMKEELNTQTESETDAVGETQEEGEENEATQDEVETEMVQTDSEEQSETLILCPPECTLQEKGTDLLVDTETEAEIPVSNDVARESSSVEECDAVSEPIQEVEEKLVTTHSEADTQTPEEETPTETQVNEEMHDSTAPPQTEVTSAQSSIGVSTSEEPAPEKPKVQATMAAVEEEEEESTEKVQENTAGEDDVFLATGPTDSNTDSNPQVPEKESQLVKDQTVTDNSMTQASGHRSSQSSGDFRIRKSSHGSRLGRRLSEDLFTVPQKISQTQSVPNEGEVKHTDSQTNPGAVNSNQTCPVTADVTSSLSAEVTERTEVQQEKEAPNAPKRFGLFRRLRGEQPKKAKAKETPKMQVPKILIQDFSDGKAIERPVDEEEEEKLSSRERRRRRRERERKEKEEERLRKKREKEMEKERERERRKPQTRGKSFQVQQEKGKSDESHPAKTGSQIRYSASHAESYF